MTPQQAAVDCTNAYEAHDRDAFTRSVGRLAAMVTLGPGLLHMTLAQLETRRAELHSQLAQVNQRIDRLEREQSQRHAAERTAALQAEAARLSPLDPSESYPFG